MNAHELAKKLNMIEYPVKIDTGIVAQAKEAGLVIVYGASDDLMEFEGAIYDEFGCFKGGTAHLDEKGLIENKCDCDDCPYFKREMKKTKTIRALWCKTEYSWAYETDIPHEAFDVMEDGEKYCRGIVFAIADLK